MAELVRTGVSIEQDLLKDFDKLIAKRGYSNRSEALRDLIRDALVSEQVTDNKPVVATLSMVYDHHRPTSPKSLPKRSTITMEMSLQPPTFISTRKIASK